MSARTDTLPLLLTRRVAQNGAGPLLTFYDDATGERVELSSISVANWVAKTANLLVDGLGLGPGDVARVALPLHWQAVVVVAGAWQAGLTVDLHPDGSTHPAVAFITADNPVPADERVVLSLAPLGGQLRIPVPGATDYAAEVPGHGDRYTGPGPAPTDEALPGLTHHDVCGRLTASSARTLVAPSGDPLLDLPLLLASYLEPLAGGGSAVLCRHADPALLQRRRAAERVDD